MLTILTVSFNSKELIELNYELTQALNPDVPHQWIVVQNSPDPRADISSDDPRFKVLPGPKLTPEELDHIGYGSFQHARALNLAATFVNSDVFLVLDPDCFILRKNWIREVLSEMSERRMHFFGAPYHPKKFQNYRDFPCAICMFVNRKQLQVDSKFFLDFSPDADNPYFTKKLYYGLRSHASIKGFVRFFLPGRRAPGITGVRGFALSFWTWIKILVPQLTVGSYRDTGWFLFNRYSKNTRHQSLDTVFAKPTHWVLRAIEFLLPDSWRTVPRSRRYYVHPSQSHFPEFLDHCEEFHWKGELFALHIAGISHNERAKALKNQVVQKLCKFIHLREKTSQFS